MWGSPWPVYYAIHCLCVVSLSSGHDSRCICRSVWRAYIVAICCTLLGFQLRCCVACGVLLLSQFRCATDGYVLADCGSATLLVWYSPWYWYVLVVVLSHCCWPYYVCRIFCYCTAVTSLEALVICWHYCSTVLPCGILVIGSHCISRFQYGVEKTITVTGCLFYVTTIVFHFLA
jgi:hypothetical protein